MDSGDRVTLPPPQDNFIDCLYGKSTVIMMLGFILKFKGSESRAQIRDNVVIYLLEC